MLLRTILPRIGQARVRQLNPLPDPPPLVVRPPWLEAAFNLYLGLILVGLIFPIGIHLGLLHVSWIAGSVVVAVVCDIIAHSCEAQALSIYDNGILSRAGFFGQYPRYTEMSDVRQINVEPSREYGFRFGLHDLEILPRSPGSSIQMRRLRDAEKARELIDRLTSEVEPK